MQKTITVTIEHWERTKQAALKGERSSRACPLAQASKDVFGDDFDSCASDFIRINGPEKFLYCKEAVKLTSLVVGVGKRMLENEDKVKALLPLTLEFSSK